VGQEKTTPYYALGSVPTKTMSSPYGLSSTSLLRTNSFIGREMTYQQSILPFNLTRMECTGSGEKWEAVDLTPHVSTRGGFEKYPEDGFYHKKRVKTATTGARCSVEHQHAPNTNSPSSDRPRSSYLEDCDRVKMPLTPYLWLHQ